MLLHHAYELNLMYTALLLEKLIHDTRLGEHTEFITKKGRQLISLECKESKAPHPAIKRRHSFSHKKKQANHPHARPNTL